MCAPKIIVYVVFCLACIHINCAFSDSYLSQFSRGVQRINDGTGYLLLTPTRFIAGSSNKLCLSRFGEAAEGMATAQIDLFPIVSMQKTNLENSSLNADQSIHRHKPIARSRRSFSSGNGGCFDMTVPKTPHSSVWILLRIRFENLPYYRINTKKRIQIEGASSIVVIQTDKPVYRCGETVRFRVLQLLLDLKPLQLPIDSISIEAPAELFGGPVKVYQWNNVSTQMGLTQLEYALDKYAAKGEWKIVVESGNGKDIDTSQSFLVTEYDLPTFYLTLSHPKNIVLSYKQIVWTICARYMYGEAVKGKLHMKVYSDSYDSKPIIKTVNLNGSASCQNYTTRTKLLGFNMDNVNDSPTLVTAEIAVQEEGSHAFKNTSAILHITRNPVSIEFVNKNKLYIRPGLPYKIKVRVTDWNGDGVIHARVRLCKQFSQHNNAQEASTVNPDIQRGHETNTSSVGEEGTDECEDGFTDLKGYVLFASVLAPSVYESFMKFTATVMEHPLQEFVLPSELNKRISAVRYMRIWSAASGVHLDIGSLQVNPSGLRPGSRYNFPLYVTFGNNKVIKAVSMHFAVITRAGILYRWGSSTLCPRQVSDDRPVQMNVPPSTICYDDHTIPEDPTFKVNLPIKISHQMCPHSHVIVYFMYEGELVVASKHFRVTDCFFYKVSQRWIPNVVSPSSNVRLRLSAKGPALCATSVSDMALKHVASHINIQTHIVRELKHFVEMRANITDYNLSRQMCFKDSSSLRPVTSRSHSHHINTLTAFRTTGLDLVSDVVPDAVDCPTIGHYTEATNEVPAELTNRMTHERSHFPETWLWELQLLHSNGTADVFTRTPDSVTRFESRVFCVSRAGVAVTSQMHSSILKVYQPFFLQLNLPSKAKRGDNVEVLYKLFNYMDSDLPVSVVVNLPDHLYSEKPILEQVSCVPGGQSVVHRLMLKPRRIGEFNVSIRARVEVNEQHQCPIKDNNVFVHSDGFVRDGIVKTLIIVAEGRTTETYKSALLCTDELVDDTGITWTFDQIEAVDRTEQWIVSVVGNIVGPISMGAEKLVSLPVGCGEQNMAMLFSNLVALDYLQSSGHLTYADREIALRNLMIGYQRQLRFRHTDGSFSAFGPRDGSGSTWLTAFTLRGLSRLKSHWNIGWDERVLNEAMQWLLEAQMENGCFRNQGQVFHKEMKGGLHSESANIALASFVLISLIDAETPHLRPNVLKNAVYCLAALKQRHGKHNNMDVTYTFALTTLAEIKIEQYENQTSGNKVALRQPSEVENLELLPNFYIEFPRRSPRALINETGDDIKEKQFVFSDRNIKGVRFGSVGKEYLSTSPKPPLRFSGGGNNALKVLRSMAIRSGDMVWWEADSLAVSIETTAYAILSLLSIGGDENWIDALGAVKWLSKYRNQNGGFISTQDTLIAMEAIYMVTRVMPQLPPDLNVTVEAKGSSGYFAVRTSNRHLMQRMIIPDIQRDRDQTARLKIRAKGTGCTLVQVTQRYNTLEEDKSSSPFILYSKITTDGPFNCKPNFTWCKCAAILEICASWNSPSHEDFPEMAVLEVNMPSGYAADRTLLYELIKKDNILLRRIEENTDTSKIFLYLALGSVTYGSHPNECYNLYLVGPKVSTSPSLIFLYDYYHTEVNISQSFVISEACNYDGNRRPHEEPMDLLGLLDANTNPNTFGSTFQDWHVIDNETDLDFPSGIEGIQPTFELPPEDFAWLEKDEYSTQSTIYGHNQNWTNVDFELDFPNTMEGVMPVWVAAPPDHKDFNIKTSSNLTGF